METLSIGLADLVDLVDVDDAALRAFQVEVGSLQQLEEQVLDVLTDVASFGKRGRITNGKRNIEHTRASVFASSVLPVPVGTDEQHVRLIEFDWCNASFSRLRESLVVIVHRDGRRAIFALILSDHILIKKLAATCRGEGISEK